jgi:hypothetical protein
MDFFSILVAIFACQNGVLIGILSAEYGLFTSLSTSDTNGTEVSQRFRHTLALKKYNFFSSLLRDVVLLCSTSCYSFS